MLYYSWLTSNLGYFYLRLTSLRGVVHGCCCKDTLKKLSILGPVNTYGTYLRLYIYCTISDTDTWHNIWIYNVSIVSTYCIGNLKHYLSYI